MNRYGSPLDKLHKEIKEQLVPINDGLKKLSSIDEKLRLYFTIIYICKFFPEINNSFILDLYKGSLFILSV